VLTSVDVNDYDVTADALSLQSILKNIHQFCTQYNMTSLIMIPQGINLTKPYQDATATEFKGAIRDWQVISDSDCYKWQEFLLWLGTALGIESDGWLDDVMFLSMEKTLHSEVESDLNGIPKHQRGSVTTLQCIIKRMVMRNQEVNNALKAYVKTFIITKFPGENFPTACLHLRAVAWAPGNKDLPTNAVHEVLEGFAKSSTD
jgi:hypothetical protein